MKPEEKTRLDELILRVSYALKESQSYDLAACYVSSEDLLLLETLRDELNGGSSRMTRAECQTVVDEFNAACPSLPAVKSLSEARQKAIAGAKKTLNGITFREYFTRAEASDFLTGRANGWHGCGFDWLMKKANILKVTEGNYDNKKTSPQPPSSSFDTDEFFAAALKRTERRYANG